MVRQRPRNKRQRNVRTNMQTTLRQLHRATNNLAVVGTPSPDPPRLKLARVLNHKIQFHLATGSDQSSPNATGDSVVTAPVSEKGKPIVFKIDYAYLLKVMAADLGFGGNGVLGQISLAINKVSVWGPPPQLDSSSICVHLMHGTFEQAATDASSGTNRPRVSITLPRQSWVSTGDANNCLIVEFIASTKSDVLTKSNFIGFVQITLAVKRVYNGSR